MKLGLLGALVLIALHSQAKPLPAKPNSPQTSSPETSSSATSSSETTQTLSNRFRIPYEKYTLSNGLEVILHEDDSLPEVVVNLWYHVGPVNEAPGRSGFAHLFEHLMFEGSKYAGRRFDTLLEAAGGTNNGTTDWDRTNYFETVPSQYLELALWLEADRMGFMIDALTQQRLDVQREVVKNERRQSYENSPYGPTWLRLYKELLPPNHPYSYSVIGLKRDLDAATLRDVEEFFATYYAPGNATLTLAGQFNVSDAKAMIAKYFGTLPNRGGRAPSRDVPLATNHFKRVTVHESVDLEQVIWAWVTPPAYSRSDAPLSLAAEILTGGRASRLYQSLVVSGLANGVDADQDSNRLTSMFTLDARASTAHSLEEIEAVFQTELTKLGTQGPTRAELQRAKARIQLAVASDLQSLNGDDGESGRAGTLQRLNHYLADPGALPKVMAELLNVSAEQVRQAVSRHLPISTRTTVLTRRPPAHDTEEEEPTVEQQPQ